MKLLKDTIISTASAGIGAVLSAFQAMVVARLLGPAAYGVIQVYRLCLTYTSFSNLGTFWAMVREISLNRGAGNETKSNEFKDVTFTLNLILSFVTIFIVLAYLIFSGQLSSLEIIDILIFFLIILLSSLYLFARNYFVAIDNFTVRSILLLIFPVFNLFLVIFLTVPFGVTGVLAAMLMAYSASLLYVLAKKKLTINIYLKKEILLKLVKTGLPICGNGLLVAIMNNIDRLIILFCLPITQLGYYGISAMLKGFLENLYRTVFLTVFPKVSEQYGKTKNIDSIRGYVWKSIIVSTYLSPFFFGSAVFAISPMIIYLLPDYKPGILSAQIVITAAYFGCIQVGIMNMIITINKVFQIYIFRISTIILALVFSVIMMKLDFGINGIALAILFSSGFLSILLIHYFLSLYKAGLKERIKHFTDIGFPFFVMCAGVLFCTYLFQEETTSFPWDIKVFIYREFTFVLFNIPLYVLAQKKTGILSEIRNMVVSVFHQKYQKGNNI